jgi:hypothetical protein
MFLAFLLIIDRLDVHFRTIRYCDNNIRRYDMSIQASARHAQTLPENGRIEIGIPSAVLVSLHSQIKPLSVKSGKNPVVQKATKSTTYFGH